MLGPSSLGPWTVAIWIPYLATCAIRVHEPLQNVETERSGDTRIPESWVCFQALRRPGFESPLQSEIRHLFQICTEKWFPTASHSPLMSALANRSEPSSLLRKLLRNTVKRTRRLWSRNWVKHLFEQECKNISSHLSFDKSQKFRCRISTSKSKIGSLIFSNSYTLINFNTLSSPCFCDHASSFPKNQSPLWTKVPWWEMTCKYRNQELTSKQIVLDKFNW